MHPILFHIGDFPIRMYGLAVAGAIFAACYFGVWLGKRRGYPWAERCGDFPVWAGVGGILAGRLWEVAFNWSYYRAYPASIMAIWEGGLSIQGGLIGGITAAVIFTRLYQIPLGLFMDHAVPSIALGQAIGRLFGCAFNGDAFGKPTGSGWGLVHAPGTMAHAVHGSTPLWPAEVFEGLFDLALMALFLRMGVNRGPGGRYLLLYLVLYSTGRFFLEFIRDDTGPVWLGLTAAQVGSLGAVALGLLLLVLQRYLPVNRPPIFKQGAER